MKRPGDDGYIFPCGLEEAETLQEQLAASQQAVQFEMKRRRDLQAQLDIAMEALKNFAEANGYYDWPDIAIDALNDIKKLKESNV